MSDSPYVAANMRIMARYFLFNRFIFKLEFLIFFFFLGLESLCWTFLEPTISSLAFTLLVLPSPLLLPLLQMFLGLAMMKNILSTFLVCFCLCCCHAVPYFRSFFLFLIIYYLSRNQRNLVIWIWIWWKCSLGKGTLGKGDSFLFSEIDFFFSTLITNRNVLHFELLRF